MIVFISRGTPTMHPFNTGQKKLIRFERNSITAKLYPRKYIYKHLLDTNDPFFGGGGVFLLSRQKFKITLPGSQKRATEPCHGTGEISST